MSTYKFNVPVTVQVNAESASEAEDSVRSYMTLHTPYGEQAVVGKPNLIPEPLDLDSYEFVLGFREEGERLAAINEGHNKVVAAHNTLSELQTASSNRDYGRASAAQMVVDDARRAAHGGFGFSSGEPGESRTTEGW